MKINFDKIYNFRDLGGIQSRNGRMVKFELLYRSGELSYATDSDWKKITETLQIQNIVDLRDENEKKINPIKAPSSIHQVFANTGPPVTDVQKMLTMSEDELRLYFNFERLKDYYIKLPIQNSGYKKLVDLFINYKTPFLFHCTAGIDRTGIGVFILYLILDVPVTRIVKNYFSTREVVLKVKPNWLIALENNQIDPTLIDFIIGSDPDYLFHTFDEILNNYDTLENYLFQEFGITEKIRKEVQDYYLD